MKGSVQSLQSKQAAIDKEAFDFVVSINLHKKREVHESLALRRSESLLDAETVHATVVVRASCTTTSLPNTSKGNPFCFSDCARQ